MFDAQKKSLKTVLFFFFLIFNFVIVRLMIYIILQLVENAVHLIAFGIRTSYSRNRSRALCQPSYTEPGENWLYLSDKGRALLVALGKFFNKIRRYLRDWVL